MAVIILLGGIATGAMAGTWWQVALVSGAIGLLLNLWLLISAAVRVGRIDRVPVALIGAIPAGLFDGIKVFVLAAVVRAVMAVPG